MDNVELGAGRFVEALRRAAASPDPEDSLFRSFDRAHSEAKEGGESARVEAVLLVELAKEIVDDPDPAEAIRCTAAQYGDAHDG